jgi:hypothetical protein
MSNKKWKLSFGLPSNIELGLVVLAFLFFILFDSAQNIGQGALFYGGNPFTVITWYGLSAVLAWWIFFASYNIVMFIVFGRALRSRKTSYKYDVIFGIISFVGLIFILGAGVGAFYFKPEEGIPYFLNIAQISIYHFGVFCQLVALTYFIITQ